MRTRPNVGAGLAAVVWLAVVAVPLYVVVVASLRSPEQYVATGPLSWPTHLTLDSYRVVLGGGFLRYLLNTVVITAVTVALVLGLAVPLAFSVVRGRGFVVSGVFRLFLIGLAIPAQAVIIPVYWIINVLGLYDTYWAVVLPTAAFAMPVAVLVLTGGIREIGNELFEAMSLDGASQTRTLLGLVVPMARSSIATVVVFTALSTWNGFLFPLILTQSDTTKVVTLGLYDFIGQFQVFPPRIFAAVVLSAVPILALYLFARRSLVAGLAGAGGK